MQMCGSTHAESSDCQPTMKSEHGFMACNVEGHDTRDAGHAFNNFIPNLLGIRFGGRQITDCR